MKLNLTKIISFEQVWISGGEVEIPNIKHQITNKNQISNIKSQTFRILDIRIYNLFGIWDLEFGILL
jgi:hypothetical protein